MPELPGGTPAPTHVYVPGQTARHPEGWFDPLKDVGADPLDSPAMRAGLDYLHAGYFWECHEVLEAVWLALPDPSAERHMVQAVIQLANARLKLAMGRPKATLRLCRIVQDHLVAGRASRPIPGLTPSQLREWAENTADQAGRTANDEL
ncbi:DUF309 domain-containing protein [Pseudosulfitobacter koreensis]|uniref:DUF309 domain-containing protein n=1 Tax=Pseudosulfitobacter koreensis TaxID=2968472 RepID=A0ABT1YVV3_9RHOB|nr:DUF309 domain-containing protein [Pseudosulfitobacter koreense]MCR8825018.1 DUF309 domain-containing protein [Pseudosulfitobacter koreense]